jgi:hypothetical protein
MSNVDETFDLAAREGFHVVALKALRERLGRWRRAA